MAIQILFIDQLHSIYLLFTKYSKHQLQLWGKQMVYKHFTINSEITTN